MKEELFIKGNWTTDCGGKVDYDIDFLCVSSMIYPDYHTCYSGSSSINLKSGIPCSPENNTIDGSIELINKDFTGESIEDIKKQIEVWVQKKYLIVAKKILRMYGK